MRRTETNSQVIVKDFAACLTSYCVAAACVFPRVVCVGGDGMFSEVLHGLVTKTQTDHGVDPNQSDADLVRCPLRIGIIPAGEFQQA